MIDMCLQLCQSPFLFLSSTSTRRIFRKCNMYKMAMKMPPAAAESTDNGIYEYQESSLSITAEEIENVEVNDFEAPPENDFSEYMWMEHEEEFDKEVMQRLEEEALMEECIAYMSSENASFQNPADGQVEIDSVVNSKLNPEAAEFIPATQRKPSEEQPSDSNESS